MEETKIKMTCPEGRELPSYATPGSAGMDLRAYLPDEPVEIAAGRVALIPTGLRMELPEGFEAQIRPRSGLALKHAVTVANSPGTIDSDYRGEIGVILINAGREAFIINDGDRICQMVIARHARAVPVRVDSLGDTARGEGGFGHTGI